MPFLPRLLHASCSFIKRFKRNFLSEENIEYRFIDHNESLVIKDIEIVVGQSDFILRHSLLERTLLIASTLKHISGV